MPELHKNQIEWNAPEPRKVSIDAVNISPVAEGFERLSRAADELSQYTAKIDDIDAQEQMRQAVDEGLNKLSKYEPDDNNYEPFVKEFEDSIKTKFNSLASTTKNRFMRNHPAYFEEQRLAADKIVFDKTQKFKIAKIDNVIPLLSSNVVQGKQTYAEARGQMEEMVAHVDNVTAENALYTFDLNVQEGFIDNLVADGQFSRALKYIDNPTYSEKGLGITTDKFTPSMRIKKKLAIQDTMQKQEAAAEALRKEATKNITDSVEEGLTNTLLFALDNETHGNEFARMAKLYDDPEAEVDLMDESGKVYAKIKVGNVDPKTRRKVLNNAMSSAQNNQAFRINALKANEQLRNYMDLYYKNRKKRPNGEQFNNIYDFVNSENAIYLTDANLKDAQELLDNETNMYLESLKPVANFNELRLLYGTGLTQFSAPTPTQIIRNDLFYPEDNVISDYKSAGEKIDEFSKEFKKLSKPAQISVVVNEWEDFLKRGGSLDWGRLNPMPRPRADTLMTDKATMYNQAVSKMMEVYEKETGTEPKPGSAIRYVMHLTAALMAAEGKERGLLGAPYATDEQIALTFTRMKGWLESSNAALMIIGQNQTEEETTKTRDMLFDKFYTLLNNKNTPELNDVQKGWKRKLKDVLATSSYGTGGGMLSFYETMHGEYGTAFKNEVYPGTFSEKIDKEQKKWSSQ